MSAVAWIAISVAVGAVVSALVYGVKRLVGVIRSEAMLAVDVDRLREALSESEKRNAKMQGELSNRAGTVSVADAASVRSWWQKIADDHSDTGAVLDSPAGASIGSANDAGDDHDTEPNAKGLGSDDTGRFDDNHSGGAGPDDVGGLSAARLRGKR